MKNKFLLGLVSVAAVSCFGSASSVDLLKTANSNWASFLTVSEPVTSLDDTAAAELVAVRDAINALDKTEYVDATLATKSNNFVKAFSAAKAEDKINGLEAGLYAKMNKAWTEYSNAANKYLDSLPNNKTNNGGVKKINS